MYPNLDHPPTSEASREVENLTEKKYAVKEFVHLSVSLYKL